MKRRDTFADARTSAAAGTRIPPTLRRPTKSLGSTVAKPALAVAISLAGVSSGFTQEAREETKNADERSAEIEVIEVYGQAGVPYKALSSGDLRHTAELASTPQTITVLTQSQLRDSGKTDLKEILAAQAGITLGTGENGNAFGDRYIIRGHEARSDVFVDGVRDPGMTTRESFATEQIEITKGPSSTFAGRGSTGGAVNGITKQASTDYNFSILEGALGTDSHHRVTFDTNKTVSDQLAFRANFLHAAEDVPDRAPAEKQRAGALLSGLYAPTEKLGFVADLYYLQADDVPDLGSYFDQSTRAPLKDVPVYLQTGSDFLDTEVKTITLKTNYAFNAGLRLQNSTRYGQTDNGYVTTGMRGTTRHASDPEAPGASTLSLSSHQGWQQVEYMVNQLNVLWDTSTGNLKHTFVMGLELTDETVTNGVFALDNTGPTNCVLSGRGATAPPQASYCALDANGDVVQNLGTLLGRTITRGNADSDFKVNTYSTYLMDTVEFSDRWSGFFGVRYDHFDYDNLVNSRGTLLQYDYSDGFWNGHIGIVRTIGDHGNVYATYSSSTNINGGESDVGGSCGYGGLCGTPDQVEVGEPETTINIELGTKWNLLNERLLLTAAAFRMTKDDVMESVGDAYSTIGTLNTGKNRVQGVEFSATGSITEKLSAQFSAVIMNSEVLESFNTDDVGRVLSNFANDSLYLQLRYDANEKVSFGGSVTYKGEMYGGQPDTAAGYNTTINDYSIVVPSYEVVDLFVNYYHSERINLRFNASNVSDEEYWVAAYRSGSFMYLGDARNVRATITWGF